MSPAADPATAPLIVHLVYRLDVGGLENGLVNLINHLPAERYRHAIVCLTDHSEFRRRIRRPDVEIVAINKRAGKDWSHYLRLFRVLRRLQPALVHSRNLATLEGQLLAALAGVGLRVHGEHGREIDDLDGSRRRTRLLRRVLKPLIGQFIAVTPDLEGWLVHAIGARPGTVVHIGNGVDSTRFHPRLGPRAAIGPAGFIHDHCFVIGSVGRMARVKDYPTLVRAFLLLTDRSGTTHDQLRLVIAGDGPQRDECMALLRDAGRAHQAWLPGARDDVASLMRTFDVFALPSLAEGASNTLLEAMASAVPVVATAVGGTPELVLAGRTGTLVPPGDPARLARAIETYYRIPGLGAHHGACGRRRVLDHYSMGAMAAAYLAVYDRLIHAPKKG